MFDPNKGYLKHLLQKSVVGIWYSVGFVFGYAHIRTNVYVRVCVCVCARARTCVAVGVSFVSHD